MKVNKGSHNKRKGVKRTKAQRERDVAYCSKLYLKGYSYRRIKLELDKFLLEQGETYTINYVQIGNDIKEVIAEWRSEALTNVDEYMTRELQKLDNIEIEAWEAWERSKDAKSKVVVKKGRGSNVFQTEETEEEKVGDAKYLDIILNVMARRAKYLGLDSPIKLDVDSKVTDETELKKVTNLLDTLPEELLNELANHIEDGEKEDSK